MSIITRNAIRGSQKYAEENAAIYGASANTLFYLPCDQRSEFTLFDKGAWGPEISSATLIGFGTVANAMQLDFLENLVPTVGSYRDVPATDSVVFWAHCISRVFAGLVTARIGHVDNDRVEIGGASGAVAWDVCDGTTTISSSTFSSDVTNQEFFKAVVVDRVNTQLHAYESINGATVSLVGSVALGALGALNFESVAGSNQATLGGSQLPDVYGVGLHRLTASTLSSVATDLETMRVNSKATSKQLPVGW